MKQLPQKVDIPGFEGLYYITLMGEVFRYGKDRPLKPKKRGDDYTLNLSRDGKATTVRIKNLMRKCYFGNTSKCLLCVASKRDFSYWNLKPVEKREIARIASMSQKKPVVRIKDGEIRFYGTVHECAQANYISDSSCAKYCNNHQVRTADGAVYMWEEDYIESHADEYELEGEVG